MAGKTPKRLEQAPTPEPPATAPQRPATTPEAPAAPSPPLALVYLDVDDEITSAAARIRDAGAERVALVLPYGSRLATSRINFRLLAREATQRGKHIEIVCADASARALAQAAGLPVYPSVAAFEGRTAAPTSPTGSRGPLATDAGIATAMTATTAKGAAGDFPAELDAHDDTQTRVLPVPRRSSARVPTVGPARPPVRTRVAVGLALATVAILLIGGFLAIDLLPSATIVLRPRSEEIGPLDLTVEARADVTEPDGESLAIPAEMVTFALEASDTFAATGVKVVETKATGNVRFSNFDTGGGVLIPTGTVVKTDSNVEFKTLSEITLPRATFDFFPPFKVHPSVGDVDVEAVKTGEGGNVGNNSITRIPKAKNTLTVSNAEATSGGARTESPEVSEADVDAAKTAIEAGLVASLDQQVAAGTGVPAGLTLFPETRTVGDPEYAVDPATIVGTEAAEFDLSATSQGTAVGVDANPIAGLAEAQVRARIKAGWTLLPSSIVLEIGTPAVVGATVQYPVSIEGTQVHDVDQAAVLTAVKGHVLAQARAVLDDFGDVEITLWPDWVTTVPTRDDRITFTLGEPQPAASPAP
jgi:hypothetical protein